MNRYVLSYPKCGRTWIKLFFNIYFEKREEELPDIVFVHNEKQMLKYYRRRDIPVVDERRLMLIRDPCDVMVSSFFQVTLRNDYNKVKSTMVKTMSEFIRHPLFGISLMNKHIETWSRFKGNQLIVRYDDLFYNIWDKILLFFELPIDTAIINKVDKECSFKSIRKNLKYLDRFEKPRRYFAIEKGKYTSRPHNPEAHKFRKGVVGGYVNYLNEEDINYIKRNFIGYESLKTSGK